MIQEGIPNNLLSIFSPVQFNLDIILVHTVLVRIERSLSLGFCSWRLLPVWIAWKAINLRTYFGSLIGRTPTFVPRLHPRAWLSIYAMQNTRTLNWNFYCTCSWKQTFCFCKLHKFEIHVTRQMTSASTIGCKWFKSGDSGNNVWT